MGFNAILKILLPKDKVFYDLFEQVTDSLIKMSQEFERAVKEKDPQKRSDYLRSLKEHEHTNDGLTH